MYRHTYIDKRLFPFFPVNSLSVIFGATEDQTQQGLVHARQALSR